VLAVRGCRLPDALIRAVTYLGALKPPFTRGYELVGVVEELGPGWGKLHVGDRVGALMVGRRCGAHLFAGEVRWLRYPRTSTRRGS
jgi:NADPH:quinone reductase-like Zn-dependent oxidoreductase